MKKTCVRLWATGLMVLSSLVAFSPPALAEWKCGGVATFPITVGALGQDLATTPVVQVTYCDDVTLGADPGSPPSLRVERDPYHFTATTVFLDIPGGARVDRLGVGYQIEGSGQDVVVPIGVGTSGQSVCLFFIGPRYLDPGGCALYVIV